MHRVDCAGDHPCSPSGGEAGMKLSPTRGGAAQHMACRVCPRAAAERIRMCAKVDDARGVTETVAFVLTRRKRHVPEEV
eukprot:2911643-Pleurochrysis_carterae.AAC.1